MGRKGVRGKKRSGEWDGNKKEKRKEEGGGNGCEGVEVEKRSG